MTFIKDWLAHIMSAIGILGGLWAYFRHDRELKNQEKRLNEMQIDQIRKAEDRERQAEIKCNVIHENKGIAKIRFINVGASNALNVRVQILTPKEELDSVCLYKKWGPYDMINPQSYREESLILCMGYPDTISVQIIWNDDYRWDRTIKLVVPL